MAFVLSPLPFAPTDLEPYLYARTFEFHHGKHHAAYVTNLNGLIKDSELESKSLEEIILAAAADLPAKQAIFNNAAQVWNHTFFWNSLTKGGGGQPGPKLLARIEADFGSLDAFKAEFKAAATGQFGSGWAWLVEEEGKLKVTKTANADLPLAHGQKALLTIDVWEHAYYLDYQNRRPDFVQAFLDHLVNWSFAEANLG